MAETETGKVPPKGSREAAVPPVTVTSSPHLSDTSFTTRRMMVDVLIGLAPVLVMSLFVFGWYTVVQVGLCVLSCLLFESLFTRLRGRPSTLGDLSAAVTGLILGLSLPWSAPWYVPVIASGIAVGIGKAVFGGLGTNIFNPAMVGRAFVMLSFARELGAGAFVSAGQAAAVLTQATPMTAARQAAGGLPGLWPLFLGNHNGSLGETSALACLIGGLYLCRRRTASWEIPAGLIGAVVVLGGLCNLAGLTPLSLPQQLFSGALLFGAFFIATDPVTSPLSPKGKFWFGVGVGCFVILIRVFSGYPEGVMFAVLLMNATVPLINRATIPRPVGGPVPRKA
jgi:electron transport complex protein RnfD